jgi:hypothetical protein
MKRLYCLLLLLGVGAPARAHFVWILPPAPGEGGKAHQARVVFSDRLAPDRDELLVRIHESRFLVRDGEGKDRAVTPTEGEGFRAIAVPGGKSADVGAVCTYGIVKRGETEPFLLHYYARTTTGPGKAKPWPAMALDVVAEPTEKGLAVRVLWKGKALPGAEVVVHGPGEGAAREYTTDKEGRVVLDKFSRTGLYGVRARHIEKRPGTFKGHKYQTVRHYATWTVHFRGAEKKPAGVAAGERKEDPAATHLLAKAREARHTWNDFRGFSAFLEVNHDGKVSRGRVEVSASGGVRVTLKDEEAAAWAKRTLGSVVAHRLSSAPSQKTPCAFADDNKEHPLGRAIRVLDDEFHSSYRIRDRQIIVVNRTMRDSRFTITVLRNQRTREGKFLPAFYVVNTWDRKTGALTGSSAHRNEWVRVGAFPLPGKVIVVTAGRNEQQTWELRLWRHKLAAPKK